MVFVEYESPEDAKAAVENMNGSEISGKTINVRIAQPLYAKRDTAPPSEEPPTKLESPQQEES